MTFGETTSGQMTTGKNKTPVKMTVGRIFRNLLILQTLVVASALGDTLTNAVGHLKLDYSVIQATGKFCPGRDSCQPTGRQNRGPEGIENDWKKRNCFCDDEVTFLNFKFLIIFKQSKIEKFQIL